MKTEVEFRSDKFPAYESEEKDINPGSENAGIRDKKWRTREEFNNPRAQRGHTPNEWR
jgi:hypothetical protein